MVALASSTTLQAAVGPVCRRTASVRAKKNRERKEAASIGRVLRVSCRGNELLYGPTLGILWVNLLWVGHGFKFPPCIAEHTLKQFPA